MRAFYVNAGHTVLNIYDPESNHTIVVNADDPQWAETLKGMLVEPFQPLPSVQPVVEYPILTRAQILKGMRASGLLTDADAVLAASGGIPAAISDIFATLSEPQKTDGLIDFATFREAHRQHPLVDMIAGAAVPPMTPEEMDAFWADCAAR